MTPLKENNGELMQRQGMSGQRTSSQVNGTWKYKIMELAKILDNKQRMIWCDIKQT